MDMFTSALLPIITGLISFLVYRHSINKDKSALVLEFNKEIVKEKPSKLVVEYLFSIIYRAKGIEFSDILLLINHPSPQRAIANFLSVQRHINAISLVDINGELDVIINKGWGKGWRRGSYQAGYFISGVAVYLLAIYFSNISYDYFSVINKDSVSALIKDAGFANFIMDFVVNSAIPILFSFTGYLCFRGWLSSLIIDETAVFLKNNK